MHGLCYCFYLIIIYLSICSCISAKGLRSSYFTRGNNKISILIKPFLPHSLWTLNILDKFGDKLWIKNLFSLSRWIRWRQLASLDWPKICYHIFKTNKKKTTTTKTSQICLNWWLLLLRVSWVRTVPLTFFCHLVVDLDTACTLLVLLHRLASWKGSNVVFIFTNLGTNKYKYGKIKVKATMLHNICKSLELRLCFRDGWKRSDEIGSSSITSTFVCMMWCGQMIGNVWFDCCLH